MSMQETIPPKIDYKSYSILTIKYTSLFYNHFIEETISYGNSHSFMSLTLGRCITIVVAIMSVFDCYL